MPRPDKMTPDQAAKLEAALASEKPELVAKRPQIQAALDAYRQYQGTTVSLSPQRVFEEEPTQPETEAPDDSGMPGSMALEPLPKRESGIPNASGRQELFTPPEYVADSWLQMPRVWKEPSREALIKEIAVRKQMEGLPFDDRLAAHWYEGQPPTVQQQMYDEFRDYKWRDAVAEAEANGYSISREEFANVPGWRKKFDDVLGMASSAVLGADKEITGGYGRKLVEGAAEMLGADREDLDVLDELEAQHPYSGVAGRVGGVMVPWGSSGAIANLSGRGLGVGKEGLGLASRMGRSAIAGGIGAGATQVLQDTAEGESSDVMLDNLAHVLPYGFLGGAGGELLGSGLRAMRDSGLKNVKGLGKDIVNLEKAGGHTQFLGGVRLPPSAAATMDDALKTGATEQAVDIAAEKAAKGIVRNEFESMDELVGRLAQEKQLGWDRLQGKTVSLKPALERVRGAVRKMTQSSGDPQLMHSLSGPRQVMKNAVPELGERVPARDLRVERALERAQARYASAATKVDAAQEQLQLAIDSGDVAAITLARSRLAQAQEGAGAWAEKMGRLQEDSLAAQAEAAQSMSRLASRAELVPAERASMLSENPDLLVLDRRDAIGFDFPDQLIPGAGERVVVDVGRMGAREVDELLEHLDDVSRMAKVQGSRGDFVESLSAGLRDARSGFGDDWVAMKQRHSDALQAAENRQFSLGLPANARHRPDSDRLRKPVEDRVLSATERGNRKSRVAMEDLLKDDPKLLQQFDDVAAIDAKRNLVSGAKAGKGGGGLVTLFRKAEIYMTDPLVRNLAANPSPPFESIKQVIDDLPGDLKRAVTRPMQSPVRATREALGQGIRLRGGPAGARLSRFVGEPEQPLTDEEKQLLRQEGVTPAEGRVEGPPTKEWYLKAWETLKNMATEAVQ